MSLFIDLPGDDGLPGAQRRLAMIALTTALALTVLDGTIVNIALPQIATALEVTAGAAIWVANGYLLAVAMTLATFASLASRVGYRNQLAAGMAIFTLASLGCALAPSIDVLIGMRLLQGIGASAILSIGPAIVRTIFPNRLLGRILGVNALIVASFTAVGPTLGGLLLSVSTWEWLFAINVPLGVIGVVLALRAIPFTRSVARGRFDGAGALLSAAAMGALIMAAEACQRLGAPGQAVQAAEDAVAYGAAAVLAGIGFVWRQRRASDPLLPLAIFATARFSMAALTSLISFVGQGMAFIALPFLFQSNYGYSALHAALLFTPWPLGIILAAPQAGKLSDRYPPIALSSAGLAIFTLGLALLAMLPAHAQTWDICWRGFICGIGFGFFQSPNNREMLSNTAREHNANASGVLAIMRTFGQCFGAALMGIILSVFGSHLAHGAGTLASAAQDAHAIRLSLWVAAAATAMATVISLSRLRGLRPDAAPSPPPASP
ncbi:MFS transporter [Massilia sp. S19_KUP03_FR1]|uniref:MFS transporter n=1 Tax=Massilia sp. S19_KUP03_FR1 TaxID=3025503 RepID=UPI002FCD7051